MNNSQKEREALLQEARRGHSHQSNPAIHPRYGAVYRSIYPSDEEPRKSTLGTRILAALILFALYAALEQGHITEFPVSTAQIIQEIETMPGLL